MKLSRAQVQDLYFALMRVLFPEDAGVQAMLAKDDTPEVRAKPGPVAGLRHAINDLLAVQSPFVGREREMLEAELARRGLPPLHVIEASRTKKYRGIIKRRKITNDEEFYIVKGLLDDQDDCLEESEIQALVEIMAAYVQERH
jgi:hypothetical protein